MEDFCSTVGQVKMYENYCGELESRELPHNPAFFWVAVCDASLEGAEWTSASVSVVNS